MLTFPTLSTGAVAQYPVHAATEGGTEVIRFIDGSDQRCLTTKPGLRQWNIMLRQLTAQELATVEQFFVDAQASFGTFQFTDPGSGNRYQCRFGDMDLQTTLTGPEEGATNLVVVEVRG